MSLANKDHMTNDSTMAIIQASAFYEQNFGSGPFLIHASPNSSSHIYGLDERGKSIYREPESPEKVSGLAKNFIMSNSSPGSSPSSTNSNNNGLGYHTPPYKNLYEEGHSLISFKPHQYYPNLIHSNGSLLSFDQQIRKRVQRNLFPKLIGGEDNFPIWEGDVSEDAYNNSSHLSSNYAAIHGLPEASISHESASNGYGVPSGVQLEWLKDQEPNTISNGNEELGNQEAINNKRPSSGECVQALKKQCGASTPTSSPSKKLKPKTTPSPSPSPSKDTQSIAAKNRRERISERLKVLQDLVPNGSKVDLVTMLEKAISYVKFLQLQVKVLATDEFWPAQDGKAPELSQVKEAIDAILASQRDRSSTSK